MATEVKSTTTLKDTLNNVINASIVKKPVISDGRVLLFKRGSSTTEVVIDRISF